MPFTGDRNRSGTGSAGVLRVGRSRRESWWPGLKSRSLVANL